ncbi:aminoacyl-histidine dipeptidase [bacterium]|nr:aminoacyl-histidine dipeptidase [bacterium]
MASILEGLNPPSLWKHFEQILQIPHCSGNEKALGDYIISTAEQNNLQWNRDNAGNIVVRKNASPGFESSSGVILQGHTDMVCEKNSDVEHDFSKDPIPAQLKGEWVQAEGTTLGADNGIGCAAALALMEEQKLSHGPLEFLFTVDEETGLTGATKIEPGFLKGKKLLNLDSEDEGEFTIGCAGGADSEISFPLKRDPQRNGNPFTLKISGLKGGHSGIDIDKERGNAIKWLARMLWESMKKFSFRVVKIEGGNKRNAIPRESWAALLVDPGIKNDLSNYFQESFGRIYQEFKAVEKKAQFSFEKSNQEEQNPLDSSNQKNLIRMLYALPHGVMSMHSEMKDLVETSTNMAIVHTHQNQAEVVCSTRSSIGSALEATRNMIASVSELSGAEINQAQGYPGWTPNLQSSVLKTLKEVYQKKFQKEPKVGAVHAGLECGIIGEKHPGMDMISFGPTIEHPHSPDERVHIGSVEKFWELLTSILPELA